MDIYQTITDTIIAAVEVDPDEVKMPWHRIGDSGLPENAFTGNTYRGVNTVALWVSGMRFMSPRWASYKQWFELGAQVKKGERGTHIVFYKTYEHENDDGSIDKLPVIRWSTVFNADQVDGYTIPPLSALPPLERLSAVDDFIEQTGAVVNEKGFQAFYDRIADEITMPIAALFFDEPNRVENYYSVLMHELTHYAGSGIMPTSQALCCNCRP